MIRRLLKLGALALATGAIPQAASAATGEAKPIEITGEVIDTWCYFSGVMGSPDAVVGSAHHTCALWCAAGGIPVGVLAKDGTVYMVLKLSGAAPLANKDTLLDIQSDHVTAKGYALCPRRGELSRCREGRLQ